MKLVAIILTYNEAEHIQACVESLRFALQILVVDSFSTDSTVQLAQSAGASVIQNPFDNYAQQRNFALNSVKDDAEWVLFVDADERVSPALAEEIKSVLDQAGYSGWRIPRFNYIFGRLTRGAGWYPDYQTRLLKIGEAYYDPERKVHEVVLLDHDLGTLKEHLIHHNYRDMEQFIAKQRKYTSYEAQIMMEQGSRPKPQNYILQPLRHFRWRFFTLKGYTDGWHGLRLSGLMAWFEFRKYVILRGLVKKLPE